jgi:hypothetical protein
MVRTMIETIMMAMLTAIIIIVIVVALVAGTALGLRASAAVGMPGKDVLERAARRARELDSQEKDGGRAD